MWVRLVPIDAHIIEGDMHGTRVRQPGVIAFADHLDDHIAKRRLTTHEELARGVIDAAHLHGRGEEDWRLGVAPLLDLLAPGELACAIEHRDAGGDGIGDGVATGIDDGDARARDAAAIGWGGLVVHHGCVADSDSGDVDDARGGPAG